VSVTLHVQAATFCPAWDYPAGFLLLRSPALPGTPCLFPTYTHTPSPALLPPGPYFSHTLLDYLPFMTPGGVPTFPGLLPTWEVCPRRTLSVC